MDVNKADIWKEKFRFFLFFSAINAMKRNQYLIMVCTLNGTQKAHTSVLGTSLFIIHYSMNVCASYSFWWLFILTFIQRRCGHKNASHSNCWKFILWRYHKIMMIFNKVKIDKIRSGKFDESHHIAYMNPKNLSLPTFNTHKKNFTTT